MDVDAVVADRAAYDRLPGLQRELADAQTYEEVHALATGLLQVYGRLAKKGELDTQRNATVAGWLVEQLADFETIVEQKAAVAGAVSGAVLLKIALIQGKYRGISVAPTLLRILRTPPALAAAAAELTRYDDLRFEVFACLAENDVADYSALVPVLCAAEKVVRTDADLTSFYLPESYFRKRLPFAERRAAHRYRATFQRAWLRVLRQPLGVDSLKQLLAVMHARVIPNMSRPQLLMDFLTDAYDFGGTVSLLALNAVFELIQHHQLDYPDFFTRLYALLADGALLASAHRARFLRMLDLFMSSTHLPAAIPAAFVKRLSRLALFAPPGAVVAVIPFVYNQLQRHPNCRVMIHRDGAAGEDVFDNEAKDPLHAHALDSSLWELHTLTAHYHPNVASLAKIMGQPFTKPQYHLEHFFSHSYETLYATENRRRRDREPALEFEEYTVFNDTLFTL